jgi:orotate phosphoribosyltransferase
MQDFQLTFIELALKAQALRFGQFKLKSGRDSPYFFNAGQFSDGAACTALGQCYAAAIVHSGVEFDMLFGPAYKGIPLVTTTAIALHERHHRNLPFAFNRKETKDHGEGGSLVGSPLSGRVLIIDDVMSAGTAVRESISVIRAAGAAPVAVVHALDRQERGQGALSAAQEVEQEHGLRTVRIVTLAEVIEALSRPGPGRAPLGAEQLAALRTYRERYGVG